MREDGESAEPLPRVLEFMQLLWAVVHGMESRSKRMSGALGVTGPQRLVLRVIGLHPGISAGRLSAILHLHPSTLTGILARLVAQRLIVRSAARDDRRRAILRLTPQGEKVNRRKGGTVEAAVAATLGGASQSEQDAVRRVLARLADHLAR
jgi:MarR family transcriptional regulator, organic hydroperoxide resistance regulator